MLIRSVVRTERQGQSGQSQSPQKQRAQNIVEMVIIKTDRLPMYMTPADKAEPNYEDLSKSELLELLKKRDTEILKLIQEKEAGAQTAKIKDEEASKILEENKTQVKEIDGLRVTLKTVTESHAKLNDRLRRSWKEGYEAGKKEVSKLLEQIFSATQVQALLTNKRVVWDKDDISGAVALYACSRKAFKFVKYKMKVPLPSEATIRRWASKIKIGPGIQEDVLHVLGKLSSTLSPEERLVCISFDEVQLSERAQYDSSRDAVIGPHKHAQAVMMRPIVGDWKQPVYFGFDEEMTPDLFEKIVERLYQVGFIVVASVCDLGPSNQGFLSEMGVYKSQESSVAHPCDPELKIHFFADVPHLLKLFRNHIIDQGIFYGGDFFGADLLRTTINLVNRLVF